METNMKMDMRKRKRKSMRKTISGLAAAFCMAGLLGGMQVHSAYAEDASLYSELSGWEFSFSSGVGAWGTLLSIHEDGSFEGSYHDTNMGETGEGYSKGTVYSCEFSGQFSEPAQVNEYTYAATIQNMETERVPGTSEIMDEVLYVYSEPHGLAQAERILFYLPGAPLEELPEEFRSWVGYYDLDENEGEELPFAGLYNEAAGQGFSGWEQTDGSGEETVSAIDLELEELAAQAAKLEDQLENDPLSQSELNQVSGELYILWDDELNSLWRRIKEVLPEEDMARLTEEELEWIAEKEDAVAAAGSEFEGGSMQPFVENCTAADWTRERVYELADYLR